MTTPNPARSSGAAWTRKEDAKLRVLLLNLVRQFPDRSVAAVLSRIEYSRPLHAWKWPEGSAEDDREEIPFPPADTSIKTP